MTDPLSILDMMILAHGSAFGAGVPVVTKFCDRSESFKKALEGTNAALDALRKDIAEELSEHVAGFLSTQPPATSLILSVDGRTPYEERRANPGDSEAYRETIHKYATKRVASLGAYYGIMVARDAWSYWAQLLGWLVYGFWTWELFVVLSLIGFGKFGGYTVPNWAFVAAAMPSIIGLVTAAVALGFTMRWQDRILNERRQHEKL